LTEKDWQEERERLEQVTAKIAERIEELEPEVANLQNQVVDIRKNFWDEVTVNTSTPEDIEETFQSIRQQEQVLAERERSHRMRLKQFQGLKRLKQSPYFGRIDFREKGDPSAERIYIGVSSFVDDDGLNFLIYDWRTPVASMYYDYPPGPASYETPDGRIEGTMELKRQYQIRDGRLANMFDTSVTIGDELLQQVLGQGADNHMKSIVATIQKEQNAIIRDDASRMLIVQGAAGSGKTSAALQRVAYLLYKHRNRITADRIVLFSPNPMFNSYVSTVLPELGEENMQQTTFQEYLEFGIGRDLKLEDPFDQIEYVLTACSEEGYEARLKGMEYKASAAFLRALQRYAERLGQSGMMFRPIRFRDRELITAQRMEEQFYSYDPSVRLANRVAMLQEWLLEELSRLEIRERDEHWVNDEIHYLDREQYARAFGSLHKERAVFDFAEQYEKVRETLRKKPRGDEGDFGYAGREEQLLASYVVRESFKPLRRSVRRMEFIDTIGLYARLFDGSRDAYRDWTGEAEVPAEWPLICRQTTEKLARGEMFYEDAAPFLYLKEMVEGIRTNTDIRYVFVDEGQDYSMFQYELLKRLFPRARMTVLGDFGQAIFTQSTELDGMDSPLTGLYGEAETRLYRLVRSYRSTRQIVEFTRALLPDGGQIVPFDRNGPKPLLIRSEDRERLFAQMVQDLAALNAEGFASIAVITKTAAESREVFELLKARGCGKLKLVTKHSPTFEKGTMVIPAYLAKGVEFDAVLISDASSEAYQRESERKLFYTACTRAMHRLLLFSSGEWSPFIRALDPSLYEVRS
jgi:DNA helicase-2/ATP-dependent DNA helicase PcrA